MGEWLHSHDTGMSSEAIFHYMALGIKDGRAPSDTSDLGRCIRLLDRFPEWAARTSELAYISDDWAALASIWDDIVAAYRDDLSKRDEGGEWRSDKMLNELWWEKTRHGLWSRRNHGFTAQGTPTRSAETTGSVGEADGGPVRQDAPEPHSQTHTTKKKGE